MNIMTIGSWKGSLDNGLAPRELEATLWAAADMTAKEIAREMGITPKTVSKRLDDARLKLGVRSVRGLVMEAFRRGLISFSGAANPSPEHQRDESHDGVFVA